MQLHFRNVIWPGVFLNLAILNHNIIVIIAITIANAIQG